MLKNKLCATTCHEKCITENRKKVTKCHCPITQNQNSLGHMFTQTFRPEIDVLKYRTQLICILSVQLQRPS